MKTKISQKEWNDKRDMFLCALYANPWRKDVGQNLLKIAEKTTCELYEVEEEKPETMHVPFFSKAEELTVVTGEPINRDLLAELDKEANDHMNRVNAESLKGAGNGMLDVLVKGVEEKTGEEVVAIHGHTKPHYEDTRPFNPKVVEIFNEFLPKEIAPLAIEAHKRSCKWKKIYLENPWGEKIGYNLWNCIDECISNSVAVGSNGFDELFQHVDINSNTITATPEQLREWFPMAYKGGTNENP
jgi:hypothetical protein